MLGFGPQKARLFEGFKNPLLSVNSMVSEQKKAYMKEYNQRAEVKARKAAYMRKIRTERNKQAARALVTLLLEYGHEDLAFEYAKERAPEMLLTVKARARASTQKSF